MPEKTKQTFIRESNGWQSARRKIGTLWCDLMHDSPMWPIHGQYQCRTCGRQYSGAVGGRQTCATAGRADCRRAGTILPGTGAIRPIRPTAADHAAGNVAGFNSAGRGHTRRGIAGSGIAFARYTAGLNRRAPGAWRLSKSMLRCRSSRSRDGCAPSVVCCRLASRNIRCSKSSGDQTVRQQVIVRYLSAEVRAAAIPASSVAITPANYKFRYKGSVKNGQAIAYNFQITPRKKREGLIKGELWLDGETGAVVRQSGYLVKKPSLFVKRVDVTRETTLRDGIADTRVTHLSADVAAGWTRRTDHPRVSRHLFGSRSRSKHRGAINAQLDSQPSCGRRAALVCFDAGDR